MTKCHEGICIVYTNEITENERTNAIVFKVFPLHAKHHSLFNRLGQTVPNPKGRSRQKSFIGPDHNEQLSTDPQESMFYCAFSRCEKR